MELFAYLVFFTFGISVGSFVNVLSDRLPRREALLFSRSHCENCTKKLGPLELIPIFSYLALRGRCRHCKAIIPARLFFVEVAIGALYMYLLYLFLHMTIGAYELGYLLIVLPLFIGIFLSDLIYGIIPDELLIVITSVTVLYFFLFAQILIIPSFITAIISLVFFLVLFFITSGRGMGFGDVKLAFVIGLFLGFPNAAIGIYLAFLTGALVSLILIAWGRKKLKKDTIPFGPFLVTAAIFSYFAGSMVLSEIGKILGI